jgi:hypothetical protein
VEEGALYPLSRCLEKQGPLKSDRKTNNGSPRRCCPLSAEGRRLPGRLVQTWQGMNEVMDRPSGRGHTMNVNELIEGRVAEVALQLALAECSDVAFELRALRRRPAAPGVGCRLVGADVAVELLRSLVDRPPSSR